MQPRDLTNIMQIGVKSYYCIIQRGVKFFCCKIKRRVKSKHLWRLHRPLKEQSCKKSHTVVHQYPLPMRTTMKTPSLHFFYSLLHNAVGSRTSHSKNYANLKPKTGVRAVLHLALVSLIILKDSGRRLQETCCMS